MGGVGFRDSDDPPAAGAEGPVVPPAGGVGFPEGAWLEPFPVLPAVCEPSVFFGSPPVLADPPEADPPEADLDESAADRSSFSLFTYSLERYSVA